MTIHIDVISRYWNMLLPDVAPACIPDPGTDPAHLKWMLLEIRFGEMPIDKENRWLGFVQGILIASKLTTVEAERDFTRPYFKHLPEVQRSIEDGEWWQKAGRIVGLTLIGFTFRRSAVFRDPEDHDRTFELSGKIAQRLLDIDSKSNTENPQ